MCTGHVGDDLKTEKSANTPCEQSTTHLVHVRADPQLNESILCPVESRMDVVYPVCDGGCRQSHGTEPTADSSSLSQAHEVRVLFRSLARSLSHAQPLQSLFSGTSRYVYLSTVQSAQSHTDPNIPASFSVSTAVNCCWNTNDQARHCSRPETHSEFQEFHISVM